MRRILVWASIVALTLGLLSVRPAWSAPEKAEGADKPIVVVSFSGYNDLKKSISWIGSLAGQPQLGDMADLPVSMALGGLAGLDKGRPWGVIVKSDESGNNLPVVGLLPVSDLKKLLSALEPKLGKAESAGEGVWELKAGDQSVFIQSKGKEWAAIGYAREHLAEFPADPLKVLGGMNEKYTLGVRVLLKNMPDALRQKMMALLEIGFQMGMARRPNETDDQYALRTKVAQQSIDKLKTTLGELEILQVGLGIDTQGKIGFLEYMVKAVEGTKTAKQMNRGGQHQTEFAGLAMSDASLVMQAANKLNESEIADAREKLKVARSNAVSEIDSQGLPEDKAKVAKNLLNGLFDVIDATIVGGKIDGGLAVKVSPKSATLVAASTIADGAKLDELIKTVLKQFGDEMPLVAKGTKLDYKEHAGLKLHKISVPVDALGDETGKAKGLLGDTLDVIVGIGPKTACVAAGRDAEKLLVEVIDKSKAESGKSVPPFFFATSVGQLFKLASALGDMPPQAAAIEKVLQQSAGKDRLTATASEIPNGMKVRVEFEEGILRVLGSIPMLVMGGGPMPDMGEAPHGEVKKAAKEKDEDGDSSAPEKKTPAKKNSKKKPAKKKAAVDE